MISRERVIRTIHGEMCDRMPIYGWLFNEEFEPKIAAEYGSRQAAEDYFSFDLAHLFPEIGPYRRANLEGTTDLTPEEVLEIPMTDPDEMAGYERLKQDLTFYQGERGRFCYVQTPGCFEYFNDVFGLENHLMYLLLYPEDLGELYRKLERWTERYVTNCIDLGVDMIHVSDDWGAQRSLLISPDVWKRLIYPYHKAISGTVKRRERFLSLHSDGNIAALLDGICDIGYDVLHPYQVSAGMNMDEYAGKYRGRFTVMGGLDVQTTLGFGNFDQLETEVREIVEKWKNGGLILCTTHMIQPHCSVEECAFAYELIGKLLR